MTTSEEQIIHETIRAFRQKVIERDWERLDYPDAERYGALWQGLEDVGVTAFASAGEGGDDEMALTARARFNLFSELGAGAPSLGFGLISHHAARSLLLESGRGRPGFDALTSSRLALLASPLDATPPAHFELRSNGVTLLSGGAARVAMPTSDSVVLHALENGRDRLLVLPVTLPGLKFAAGTSSHGLRLIPVGELRCDNVEIDPGHVLEWPSSGRAAREADGQLTALLSGMLREMAERAMAYALTRYQGGKMIHQHDAVRDLVGPMLVAARSLEALAIAALDSTGPGDGGASAFAVEIVRQAGLDAIQVFGGYGYMEDYRVERYFRDANTLETFWVHSSLRRRTIAARRFSEMSAQETP